jgi:hypothetical protein
VDCGADIHHLHGLATRCLLCRRIFNRNKQREKHRRWKCRRRMQWRAELRCVVCSGTLAGRAYTACSPECERERDRRYQRSPIARLRKRLRDQRPTFREKKHARDRKRAVERQAIFNALRQLGWLRGLEIVDPQSGADWITLREQAEINCAAVATPKKPASDWRRFPSARRQARWRKALCRLARAAKASPALPKRIVLVDSIGNARVCQRYYGSREQRQAKGRRYRLKRNAVLTAARELLTEGVPA